MTTFSIVAAILFLAAGASVVLPLLRRAAPAAAPASDHSNLSVLSDQLTELEADVASGTLGADELAEGRLELERRLLDEVAAAGEGGSPRIGTGRPAFVLLAVLAIPAAASLIYFQIGRFDTLVATPPAHSSGAAGVTDVQSLEKAIQSLSKRLESNPDDAQGWLILARSYTFLRDFPQAVAAWERAHALVGDNPDVLTSWCDTLVMANGGRFDPQSLRLIERALVVDPNHNKALWLAGTAAYESGDYPKALEFWERLAALAPQGSELAQKMASNIVETRALIGQKTPDP
jgi:cytochrome c-type biogenesis protein CcmH